MWSDHPSIVVTNKTIVVVLIIAALHRTATAPARPPLQIDILNTEAHNVRLADALHLLSEELDEKARTIEKYEGEIKRRGDAIEKKTREIDTLNRKLEKLVSGVSVAETGPLEATIVNVSREIDQKNVENRELQRRWVSVQGELVALQAQNNSAAEALTRMRAERTILSQKKRRLELTYEDQLKEIRKLQQGMTHLRTDLQRVNGLIAQNSAAREALSEDNFNLESKVVGELRDMEGEAARLQSTIDEARRQKRDVLSEMVEVERQIMLWERKIELEKEMRAVLDPSVGQDVVADMKREIHRMELRLSGLQQRQEFLITEMERALTRRELLGVKQQNAATKRGADLTRAQLDKSLAELSRSVKETEKETAAADARIAGLQQATLAVATQLSEVDATCRALREQEELLKQAAAGQALEKYRLFLATTRQQRLARRYEEVEQGKYKPAVEDEAAVDAELKKAIERRAKIASLIADLKDAAPHLTLELDRVLLHMTAAEA